jgi:hypothetical protein
LTVGLSKTMAKRNQVETCSEKLIEIILNYVCIFD